MSWTFYNSSGEALVSSGGDVLFGGNTFGGDKVIGSNDNYDLAFKTNNTNRVTIDNAGEVFLTENDSSVSITKGIAKAWMQFYHAVTVHSSYNSSITHTDTGKYTVTLTTNMENGNYAVAMAGSYDRLLIGSNGSQNSTSSLFLYTAQFDGTLINVPNDQAQTVGFAVYGQIT